MLCITSFLYLCIVFYSTLSLTKSSRRSRKKRCTECDESGNYNEENSSINAIREHQRIIEETENMHDPERRKSGSRTQPKRNGRKENNPESDNSKVPNNCKCCENHVQRSPDQEPNQPEQNQQNPLECERCSHQMPEEQGQGNEGQEQNQNGRCERCGHQMPEKQGQGNEGQEQDQNSRCERCGHQMPEEQGQGKRGQEHDQTNQNTSGGECSKLFEGINKYRQSRGLKPLQRDSALDKAAKVQSNHMASTKTLSHTGPPGQEDFQTRIKNAGGNPQMGNENVAQCISDNFEALNMWIKSPGHNKNLLSDTNKIGLASTESQDKKPYVTMVAGQ